MFKKWNWSLEVFYVSYLWINYFCVFPDDKPHDSVHQANKEAILYLVYYVDIFKFDDFGQNTVLNVHPFLFLLESAIKIFLWLEYVKNIDISLNRILQYQYLRQMTFFVTSWFYKSTFLWYFLMNLLWNDNSFMTTFLIYYYFVFMVCSL